MPQNDKINVRGVYFDNVTMDEAFRKAVTLIETEGFSYMVTPNSEIVQACVENPALYDVVNTADLTIPDGIGVVYASKILKTPLKEKVAGVEILHAPRVQLPQPQMRADGLRDAGVVFDQQNTVHAPAS